MQKTFNVIATWDDDASVWVATNDDVPGLITEAVTTELMIEKLKILIPELLDANGEPDDLREIPFTLRLSGEVDAS